MGSRSFLGRFFVSRTRPQPLRRPVLPLSLQALEDRTVPSTYNVTGLADGIGTVSSTSTTGVFNATTLRAAITAANAAPGNNTINLSVAGTYTLSLPPNQTVLSATLNNGGTGYATAPTVNFTNATGDTTGSGATATATVAGGVVTGVTITNHGTGYTQPPVISFTGGGGTGAVATAVTDNENNTNGGDLDIVPNATSGSLTILNSSGGNVAVNGNGQSRVFDINPTASTAVTGFSVTFGSTTGGGFTIENGYARTGDGAAGSGGGIRDQGNTNLTLNNMVVTNNAASADGGGISMENLVSTPWTLNLNNTTVSNNRAGDAGGGVESDGSGKVNFTNSTITGNTTTNQSGGFWADAIAVGTVTLPTITTSGAGYTTAPSVTFTGGGASDEATGVATINAAGQVTGIIITNSGAGYTAAPTITLSAPPAGGTQATATASFVAAATGPQSATTKITTTTVSYNDAGAFGGGIGNAGNGAFIITSSTVNNNYSGGSAGGFGDEAAFGTLQVVNSTFVNNTAQGNGGGIYEEGPSLIVDNSTVTGNSAAFEGGGIFYQFGSTMPGPAGTTPVFTLNNTIVANNVVGPANFTGTGGPIFTINLVNGGTGYATAPTVNITNAPGDTTGTGASATASVAGGMVTGVTVNTTGTGYTAPPIISFTGGGGTGAQAFAVVQGVGADVFGAVTTGSGNFIGIGEPTLSGITNGTNGNQVGTPVAPLNPNLGPLQNNGGPTQTRLPIAGSPVIDKGITAANPTTDPITGNALTDQRGALRVVGAAVDVGATEFQAGATTVTLTVSSTTPAVGTQETFTAVVAATATGPNNPITGTVTFFNGATAIGTATVTNGTATLKTTLSVPGAESITAVYTPDATATGIGYTTSTSTATTVTIGTANQIMVEQFYLDLLNRNVDSVGLTFWTNLLNGTTSATAVATGIMQSGEFFVRETTWLFGHYLNRTPGQSDLNFWIPFFQNGGTMEQAGIMIVSSAEFTTGLTQNQIVTKLYVDALGRQPTSAELTANANTPIVQLAQVVFASTAYENHTVQLWYQDFLRRAADVNGINFYTNFYAVGSVNGVQPDVQIIAALMGSPEYASKVKANPFGLTPLPADPLLLTLA